MKRYFSGLITGIALTILVGSLVIGASAISSKMTIEVDPINVQVNGEVFQPKDVNGNDVPVFSYNGTTYAPLRALAEAYGLEVGYDAGSNMATVAATETKTTETPETTATHDTTTKADYSDWSDEKENTYQEFKALWDVKDASEKYSELPNETDCFICVYSGTESVEWLGKQISVAETYGFPDRLANELRQNFDRVVFQYYCGNIFVGYFDSSLRKGEM